MTDPRLPLRHAFSASDKLITVEVGSIPKSFSIHESVLCSTSSFFKTRKKPEWSRGGATIKLPEHCQKGFDLYVNWLYRRKIPTEADTSHGVSENDKEWTTLASAYVLGEAMLDTAFKDTVIDALRSKVRSSSGSTLWTSGGKVARAIYDGTPDGSPARKFLVNVFATHAGEKDLTAALKTAP